MSSRAAVLNADDLQFIWERVQKRNSKDDFVNKIKSNPEPVEETLEGRGEAESSFIRKNHWDVDYAHGLKGKLILRKSGDDFSRMQVAFYHDGDDRDEEDAVGGPGGYAPGYTGVLVSVICDESTGKVEPKSYALQVNVLEGACGMSFNISADTEKKKMVVRMIEEAIESAKANLADAPIVPAPDQQKRMFA